jgi:hypothetical protein
MAQHLVVRDVPGIFGRPGKPDAVFPIGTIVDTSDPAAAKALTRAPASFVLRS